jgi:hypothetical protein
MGPLADFPSEGKFEAATLGSSGKHTNHYAIEVTSFSYTT